MGLVRHTEAAHRLDLEFGGLGARRPLHLAHDRGAEGEVRVHSAGVGDGCLEAREDLVVGAGGHIHADRVHEAKSGVEASVGLTRVVFRATERGVADALAVDHRLPRLLRVGEVVRGCDAVAEEVEGAVQRRPIDVVGGGVRGQAEHRVTPAVEGVGDAEAAQAAREQVAVARDETGGDERAVDVEHLVGLRVGRVARTDRGDPPVFDAHPPALDVARIVGSGGNRDETGVDDQERHGVPYRDGMSQLFTSRSWMG